MKHFSIVATVLVACGIISNTQPVMAENYPNNPEPMAQLAFVPLPLGSVHPDGWLKNQLEIQAEGLTGYLDEFWPSVRDTAWRGLDGDAWERAPYYLDGLVPLAYLLDNERLIKKAQSYIDFILLTQQKNGWFGPVKNKDRWPLAVAMKSLTQYYEATEDERVLELLGRYFEYIVNTPPDWPDGDWRGVRAMENNLSALWMYRKTKDPIYLQAAQSISDNCYKWDEYFAKFPYTDEEKVLWKNPIAPENWSKVRYVMTSHGVNIAMALKYPGIKYLQTGDKKYYTSIIEGFNSLDRYHGQVTGIYSCDEHVAGKNPTQGTELCAVTEAMFSLENLTATFGDVAFADRLESLAYNALPGTMTADGWTHQYDQQVNQVECTVAKRNWTNNGDHSNVYGLEPNFGCCTANMHQGWPKFVSYSWMATKDNGLAAVALGPNIVSAKVADGVKVNIIQETDYPFAGEITYTVATQKDVKFPLYIRIPSWAEGTKIVIVPAEQAEKSKRKKLKDLDTILPKAGAFVKIDQEWKNGDSVKVSLPMELRCERRYNNSIAIFRGPLVYSLAIEPYYKRIAKHNDTYPYAVDWEVLPNSDWNYALLVDPENLKESIKVKTSDVPFMPFAEPAAPVVLNVKACQVDEWTLVDQSAGPIPDSPVIAKGRKTETVSLVPYGCTQLRITEFPLAVKK